MKKAKNINGGGLVTEKVNKEDAPLYIDVECYSCKRTIALSNSIEHDGRHYCNRCYEDEFAVLLGIERN